MVSIVGANSKSAISRFDQGINIGMKEDIPLIISSSREGL